MLLTIYQVLNHGPAPHSVQQFYSQCTEFGDSAVALGFPSPSLANRRKQRRLLEIRVANTHTQTHTHARFTFHFSSSSTQGAPTDKNTTYATGRLLLAKMFFANANFRHQFVTRWTMRGVENSKKNTKISIMECVGSSLHFSIQFDEEPLHNRQRK